MKKTIFITLLLVTGFCLSAFSQMGEPIPVSEEIKFLDFMRGEWKTTAQQLDVKGKVVREMKITMKTEDLLGGRIILARGYIGGEEIGNTSFYYDSREKSLKAISLDAFGNIDKFTATIEGETLTLVSEPRYFPSGKLISLKRVITKLSENEHRVDLFVSINGKDWVQNFTQVEKRVG